MHTHLRLGLLAGIAAVAATVAVADARPREQAATLVATEYQFSPDVIHAVAGYPLKLTVINRGHETHGVRFELSYGALPLPMNVPPGRTVSTVIENLGDPGTYRFYCPVDDHAQRGMMGRIVIAAPRSNPPRCH